MEGIGNREQGIEKIYELKIPVWNAAIPNEWKLEVQFPGLTGAQKGFQDVGGREIHLSAGALLRGNGGPEEECLKNMLDQGYVKVSEPRA